MKVLLVGEYSNLHNSLKEGLIALGHEVTLVSTGDSFKNLSTDHSIHASFTESKIGNILFRFLRKIKILNLEKSEKALRFFFFIQKQKQFDCIQLINSNAIESYPFINQWLYKQLLKKTKNLNLLVCGDEVPIVDFYLKNKNFYNILTPMLEDESLKIHFSYPLKYTQKSYKKVFDFLKNHCNSIITSDFDYEIPMKKMGFKTHFIPNPINCDKIVFNENKVTDKIVILLGINRFSYYKKGIVYFEQALKIIKEKYSDKVEIIISENVPYKEYVKIINKSHIVLDQIFAHDQGYNALTAMAQGKVVFTGAEKDWLQYFNLEENNVAINALPNVEDIVSKLDFLINNPKKIEIIGKNTRKFIEKEHHYIQIATKYLEAWSL